MAVISAPTIKDLNLANNTVQTPTTVTALPADLTITKTHSGNFAQGQFGATRLR